MSDEPDTPEAGRRDFIRAMIDADLEAGKVQRVVTRFPPEPNGYLHFGHAWASSLNHALAQEYGGEFHLRFDDTNPEGEDPAYVEAIQRDLRWLGCDWGEHLYFASDDFERYYADARRLVEMGKAYVCDLSEEEFREYRGTITSPGKDSPYRTRSVEENTQRLERMRAGEFEEGACVLRAKVDMASPNMKMRDPPIFRIKKMAHYRTGDAWCIYPIYDFAHPLEDAYEGITHSLCSSEFKNNRELYDWYLDTLGYEPRPYQTEFGRTGLTHMIMSKRYLLRLVNEGHVAGWDDPRMPTLAGFRRRGVRPKALRDFCAHLGVSPNNSTHDQLELEHALRADLNHHAPRRMGVLRPLKLVLTNYPEGETEELEAADWPHDVPKQGSRPVPFGRELWIEREDFAEDPPPGFHRLAPGREVRLRYAYLVTCTEVVKDEAGEVVAVHATYDPATRGGNAPDGRKVKGTLHWAAAHAAVDAEVRLYDRLFQVEHPGSGELDFLEELNPDSLQVLTGCKLEPALGALGPGEHVQLERQGYFFTDPEDSAPGAPVFNRTVPLKDSWARKAQAEPAPRPEKKGGEKPPAAAGPRDYAAGLDAEGLARFEALRDTHGVPVEAARALAEAPVLARMVEDAAAAGADAPEAAKLVANEVVRELGDAPRDDLPFGGAELAELVALLQAGDISSKIAKKVVAHLVAEGGSPRALVEEKGWSSLRDPAKLRPLVDEVLAANPENVAKYRGGKTGLLGFFTGQVMKRSQGRADPAALRALLEQALGE